eukprot:2921094-Amphidinium_carterae.1
MNHVLGQSSQNVRCCEAHHVFAAKLLSLQCVSVAMNVLYMRMRDLSESECSCDECNPFFYSGRVTPRNREGANLKHNMQVYDKAR